MAQFDYLKDILVERVTSYEFTDQMLSEKEIDLILEAGRMSPSSHNSQPWKFIVIKDKQVVTKLVEKCIYGLFYQPPPVLIGVVLENIKEAFPGMSRGKAERLFKSHMYMNVGFCSSNMVNEAQALGIDSCILSPFVDEANKILKVPNGKECLLLLGFGYRKKGSYSIRKERKAFKDVVTYERYK